MSTSQNTLSPRSRINKAQQELSCAMHTLVRIGDEFNQAIVDSANETAMYRSRIAELERRNREASATENEAAHRKLRRVKRVMGALLEEIGAWYPDNPDSDRSPRLEIPQLRTLGSPPPPSASALLGRHSISPQCVSPPSSPPRSISSPSGPPPPFKSSTLGPELEWRMSTNRTPKSAEVICPIPWKWLQQRLGLDEDMLYSLESLSQMDNVCLRVQIVKNMAFVYEPFSMDCPSASMILDWGSPTDNLTTARHISDNVNIHPFLHTFILPVKKDVWYYIGAHTWKLTRLFSVWPTLGDRSKQKVVDRLRSRCREKHSSQDIRQMLDNRRLVQLCVEVSSTSLTALSQAFAKDLDYSKQT